MPDIKMGKFLFITVLLLLNINIYTYAATLETNANREIQSVNVTSQQNEKNIECRLPFQAIGGRCLLLETLNTGTWAEMKLFCSEIGGQMLKMNVCGVMYYVVQFIQTQGLPANDYWIGMNDRENEGEFVHLDGTPALMGSPFWYAHIHDGIGDFQEPNNIDEEDCVSMSSSYYYYLNDQDCEKLKNVICEQVSTSEKSSEEDSDIKEITYDDCQDYNSISGTSKENGNVECRLPFMDIGGRCIFVDTLSSGTWSEMKLLCQEVGGVMLKMDKCGFIYHIKKFIKDEGLPDRNYWIGMSDLDEPGHYVHLDGTSAHLGTPYWAVDSAHGIQEPDDIPGEHCVEMRSEFFYYLNNHFCDEIKNVICQQV